MITWSAAGSAQIAAGPEMDAWKHFYKGIELLEQSRPRTEVLTEWEAGLRIEDQSGLAKQIAEDIPLLKRQIIDDKEIALEKIVKPGSLPIQQRIDYYIKRFVDVHGTQPGQPGFCHTVGFGNIWSNNKVTQVTIGSGTEYSCQRCGKNSRSRRTEHQRNV